MLAIRLGYRPTVLSCTLVGLLLASCGHELDLGPINSTDRAIVNGALDQGHPAVGMLYMEGAPGCTATLVGGKTVLTAAHCVTNDTQPPYTILDGIGFWTAATDQIHPSVAVVVHPTYSTEQGDIAVVRLAQPVPATRPHRISATPPALGNTLTLVGFGQTSGSNPSSFGTKHIGTTTVSEVTAVDIVYSGGTGSESNVCSGDSGGPAFVASGSEEVQVGVHSWAEDGCVGLGGSVRVDRYHSWIEAKAMGDLYTGGPVAGAPPSVSIVEPSDGERVGNSVTVAVEATDDFAVVAVTLKVDGQLVGEVAAPPYSFTVQGLTSGAHSLQAEARDEAGAETSSTISVTAQPGALPPPGSEPPPIREPAAPSNDSADPSAKVVVLGGCSAARGEGGATNGLGLLLAVVLGALCRRRR